MPPNPREPPPLHRRHPGVPPQPPPWPLPFGHPAQAAVGQLFANRIELSLAGVHRQRRRGIGGSQAWGSDSIVLSAAYEDDDDRWDRVLYTGEGGRDPARNVQVADQDLARGNLALVRSCERGLPLRLVRGPMPGNPYAPESGYRYDGLYRVAAWWADLGRSGHRIYRYELLRWPDDVAHETQPASGA